MKEVASITIALLLTMSVAACGESKDAKAEKAANVFAAPYTEKIPLIGDSKMDPHLFDIKKPAQEQKQ